MNRRLFYSVVLMMVMAVLGNSQWKLEPQLHSLIASGIDYIYKQEYDRADSLFRDVAARYPRHPAGYLYQVGGMQAYAVDFTVPVKRNEFDSLLVLGKKTAENLESPWKEYFIGTADGYDAYERVERGDWFGGVRKGISSVSKFEEVVENDSSFYDAFVGIGTYYYWSSRKTAFLRWLPFIEDNRELGVKVLIEGAEHSEYNRFAGISALISIYLDTEDYNRVEEWSECGLKFYPENRIFLWGLATALDRQKRFKEAVVAYEILLENILQSKAPHPYGEIICRLNLVKSKLAVNDTIAVSYNLNKILAYENIPFPINLQSRAEEKFEEVHALLSEIDNLRAASE